MTSLLAPTNLPIEAVLDQLKQQLSECDQVVLEAPPGAGKTTIVPLALLDQPWLAGRKILMLEPRRIATKSAALRMASLIGEAAGETVGYRMRLDSKSGPRTQIEVISEGILTRMLQQDPSLAGVGLVIFDEFHERNLESDLALALCLKGRELFRSDDADDSLKILVMSATLDSAAIAELLGGAPQVKSEGRSFPVDIVYGRAAAARERIGDRMVTTIQQALEQNPTSSLLAFLPGQGEIRYCHDRLGEYLSSRGNKTVHLHPMYGQLSIEEQQQAIAPLGGAQANDQKVVLATNIAETSLTIEGVDVVVDCGQAREARFDPGTGMTGLHTVKISAASSIQRAGRAGRLKAGKCYRLWSAEQQKQLAQHRVAEIVHADLAPLVLQLLQWGIDDPDQLDWLDSPPRGHWLQAIELLQSLGAIEPIEKSIKLSAHGEAMASVPVHPRLAHLLISGAAVGFRREASWLASLLSERDPFSQQNPDIAHRFELLSGEGRCPGAQQGWLRRTRQLAQQFEQQLPNAKSKVQPIKPELDHAQLAGFLLACAYPDRVARRRHSGGYQLANGRSASLVGDNHLGNNAWLAVAEVSSLAGGNGSTIRSAAALDEALFATLLADLVRVQTVAEWNKKTSRFIAEEQHKIGALVLQRKALTTVPAEARNAALIALLQKEGLRLLGWNAELDQWCARVSLLRSLDSKEWPDFSADNLLATAHDWLAPYLHQVNLLADFKKLKVGEILQNQLSYDKQQRLNELAPLRFKVPSGSSIAIDYRENPPVLAVKLQEMFGCEATPTVANGKLPLLIHLLSPAGRPLQITQDLAGFWRSSYHDVKKEMKGRYPKHPWPDDPLTAVATRWTKARSKGKRPL